MTRSDAIAADLRQHIQAGTLVVGDSIPTQAALCKQHGVSRFTVREAVRRLEEEGLVESRQGAPTRVINARSPRPLQVEMSTEIDVLNYAAGTVLVTDDSWVTATAGMVGELELDHHTRWLTLEAVRKLGGSERAIGVTRLCVSADLSSALASVQVSGSSAIFVQMVDALGLTGLRIEQEVFASTLSRTVARRLGVADGGPSLVVLRRFLADDVGLFLAARTVHPAELFRFRQRLRSRSQTVT